MRLFFFTFGFNSVGTCGSLLYVVDCSGCIVWFRFVVMWLQYGLVGFVTGLDCGCFLVVWFVLIDCL